MADRERIYENQSGYEKGAFISGDSPYHSFFKFHNEHCWPYNEFYDGWWGHNTLPKLNYEDSEKLYEDILRIAKNGFLHRFTWMAGVWMWQRIWGTVQSTIISSGGSSERW